MNAAQSRHPLNVLDLLLARDDIKRALRASGVLVHAVTMGHVAVVKLLLQHGANPRIEADYPLLLAAATGNRDLLQAVLDAISRTHSDDAARYQEYLNTSAAELLGHMLRSHSHHMHVGASNPNFAQHKKTAWYCAQKYAHIAALHVILPHVLPYLEETGPSAFYRSVVLGHAEVVRFVFDSCSRLISPSIMLSTLHEMVSKGDVNAVSIVLNHARAIGLRLEVSRLIEVARGDGVVSVLPTLLQR